MSVFQPDSYFVHLPRALTTACTRSGICRIIVLAFSISCWSWNQTSRSFSMSWRLFVETVSSFILSFSIFQNVLDGIHVSAVPRPVKQSQSLLDEFFHFLGGVARPTVLLKCDLSGSQHQTIHASEAEVAFSTSSCIGPAALSLRQCAVDQRRAQKWLPTPWLTTDVSLAARHSLCAAGSRLCDARVVGGRRECAGCSRLRIPPEKHTDNVRLYPH